MDNKTREIIEFITLYMEGELSDEQREVLTAWIQEREENLLFFQQVTSREKLQYKLAIKKGIDQEKAFERFRSTIRPTRLQRFRKIGGYAAIILFVIGWVFVLLPRQHPNVPTTSAQAITSGKAKATLVLAKGERIELSPERLPASLPAGIRLLENEHELIYKTIPTTGHPMEYNKLITPRGGEYKIRLPDGTFVQLNSNTSLKYPVRFDSIKREVHLSGEAYFEVTKEENRPFYVITDVAKIKVYGTSFNINTRLNNQLQATLVDGSIGIFVQGDSREYIMRPRQQAEVNNDNKEIAIRDIDPYPYTAWKDGIFLFDNERLETIMEKLALWYDVELFYQNETVKNVRFTGYLKRYDTIDVILDAIEATVSATFIINKRTVMINQSRPIKE